MRCRALARALRRRGAEVVFFCRRLPVWLSKELESDGFRHVPLGDDDDEIEMFLECLQREGDSFDWLVADHYGWHEQHESAAASYVRRLMVIDDLADRRHCCQLLLDQNDVSQSGERYLGRVPPTARLLLGSRYALLREEFPETRAFVRRRDGFVRTLLVCFGGTDPTNETAKTLEALDFGPFAELNVHVVIGRSHSHLDLIAEKCRMNPRIRLHIQTNQMAKLMAESDLALCAGGTMTWERFCMGLPGIVISVADNQIELARTSQRFGVDWYLGESAAVDAEQIRRALLKAMDSPERIRQGQRIAMNRVDGLGAERVADIMFGKA
jgi:UDP-2,4-diacetamido-2,4,6-trideoxy-beta-L-altropyranose hydrolase